MYPSFRCSWSGRRRLAGAVLLLLGPIIVRAQTDSLARAVPMAPVPQVTFTGAVFSSAGGPLPGAIVTLEGRPLLPVVTNADGFFVLHLPAGQPFRMLVDYPECESQVVELRAPEAEKNLVVTLQALAAAEGKSARSRRSRSQ